MEIRIIGNNIQKTRDSIIAKKFRSKEKRKVTARVV
jgi:hypothetical protein